MARFQKIGWSTTLLAVLVLLCVAGIFRFVLQPHHWAAREQAKRVEARQTEWRMENVRDLKQLNAVVRLSVQEQARVDQAGDDSERVRKALIDLHEQRLAVWSERLEDAQDRRRELQGANGYTVYGDHPQSQDVARLIDRDEREATAQVAIFAEALDRIKAWRPTSFDRYVAAHTPPANPQPARVSTPAAKPSAYVGSVEAPSAGSTQPPAAITEAGGELPVPPLDQIPASVTVYAAPAPIVRQAPEIVSEPTGQVPNTQAPAPSVEEGVQTTLRRWSTAMVSNDPRVEAAEYAPHMERYFLRMNVDKKFVEADKRDYLRRGNVTADFTLRDVVIENETDATAEVRLTKDVTWQRPSGAEHKLIRSRLLLQKFVDGWKITGEQDFR